MMTYRTYFLTVDDARERLVNFWADFVQDTEAWKDALRRGNTIPDFGVDASNESVAQHFSDLDLGTELAQTHKVDLVIVPIIENAYRVVYCRDPDPNSKPTPPTPLIDRITFLDHGELEAFARNACIASLQNEKCLHALLDGERQVPVLKGRDTDDLVDFCEHEKLPRSFFAATPHRIFVQENGGENLYELRL